MKKYRSNLPLLSKYSLRSAGKLLAVCIAIYILPKLLNDAFFILVLQTIAYTYIAVLGLDFLVGYTGQKSLGHHGFFAIGGYTTVLLTTKLGLGFWWAFAIAIVFSCIAGLLLAVTAFRAKGPYIAMVTIAFGFLIEVTAHRWVELTNGPMGIFNIAKPSFLGARLNNTDYFYLIAYCALFFTVLVSNLLTSRVGRTLLAIKESEVAAESLGINVYVWKTVAFVVSGALAGIGGVFFAHQSGYINSESFRFSQSILFLAAAILGGSGTILGPLVGTVILVILPHLFAGMYAYYQFIYGGILLLSIIFFNKGIVGTLAGKKGFQWLLPKLPSAAISNSDIKFDATFDQNNPLLRANNLSKHFGGIRAVDSIDYHLYPNKIYGLIGPNGSGKSTLINVLSGVYKPTTGEIVFNGKDIAGWKSHNLAKEGIARTFQNIRLFKHMSVLENILVGFHIHLKAGFWSQAFQTKAAALEEERFTGLALRLLKQMCILEKASVLVDNLPYGHQRLVEIARALATFPSILFLDEPAAGMNPQEIKELRDIILSLKAAGIPSVVVIEHHMDLVMNLCEAITVLDFGQKICEGTPKEVQSDSKVCTAYLGVAEAKAC